MNTCKNCGHNRSRHHLRDNSCCGLRRVSCPCTKFEPQEGPIKTNTSEDKNAPSINCECGHTAEIHLAGTGACQQPFCFPDARHNTKCSCQKFKLEESPAEASQLSCRVPPSGGEIGGFSPAPQDMPREPDRIQWTAEQQETHKKNIAAAMGLLSGERQRKIELFEKVLCACVAGMQADAAVFASGKSYSPSEVVGVVALITNAAIEAEEKL